MLKEYSCLREDEWEALQNIFEKIYLKEKNDSQEYWHYTSSNGILGIFKDFIDLCNDNKVHNVSECSILASNIRFMNDEKEYKEGDSSYERLLEKADSSIKKNKEKPVSKNNDNIYLISFCGEGDLLSQWKWYGKNSGISVCFNLESMQYRTYDYVDKKGKKCDDQFFDEHTKPIRVKYSENEKENFFNDLIQHPSIVKSDAYNLVKPAFIPFCKDESFSEEKESRLVFYTTQLSEGENLKTKFNIVYNNKEEGRIKPALNTRFALNSRTTEKNIISKIIVGPGVNQELLFNFLIHLFDRKNYFYHTEEKNENELIEWEDFLSKNDRQMHYIMCYDKRKRYGYLCENGLVIMKSTIPFRG